MKKAGENILNKIVTVGVCSDKKGRVLKMIFVDARMPPNSAAFRVFADFLRDINSKGIKMRILKFSDQLNSVEATEVFKNVLVNGRYFRKMTAVDVGAKTLTRYC